MRLRSMKLPNASNLFPLFPPCTTSAKLLSILTSSLVLEIGGCLDEETLGFPIPHAARRFLFYLKREFDLLASE